MRVSQLLVSTLLALIHSKGVLALPATDVAVADDDTSSVSSLTTTTSTRKCKTPLVRKEWRALSKSERLGFIAALKCLQAKPAKTGRTYAGAKSRYDDYQALHIQQTDFIHFDGVFLPWHRYMLYLFEQDLRSTCGYTGTIPYWNWSLDAVSEAAVLKSPVFDPTYGFGGNGPYIADVSGFPDDWKTIVPIPGRLGGGCITDGPFASRQIPMGPANHTEYTPHCLRRDISPYLITMTANATCLNWALNSGSHFQLDRNIEGLGLAVEDMRVHAGGHIGVGGQIGEMANMYSSPGDPLFWLHHSMIDHVWDQWQRKNFAVRSKDIGGPDTMWAYPYNYFGDIPYKNITLQTTLNYPLIANSIKVSDIMDTLGGLLCYTYA